MLSELNQRVRKSKWRAEERKNGRSQWDTKESVADEQSQMKAERGVFSVQNIEIIIKVTKSSFTFYCHHVPGDYTQYQW